MQLSRVLVNGDEHGRVLRDAGGGGLHVIGRGHKLAVLAIDPTSPRSGGSILGDKTRMEYRTRDPAAFLRPSPAGGTLGGVARRTREAMLLCEAAGYDVIVIETVGVGQSETAVADMVDLFMVLLLPAGGDELQGIKKGIVELADLLVVNKADGALATTAQITVGEYRHALQLLRAHVGEWKVPVLSCSAVESRGVAEIWDTVGDYRLKMESTGALGKRRAEQAKVWLWSEIRETLLAMFQEHPEVAGDLGPLETRVARGELMPGAAARRLLGRFLGNGPRQD
ncbi:LAO/AO transport system kinase [uncultured Gammaproteobacteria bacterium]